MITRANTFPLPQPFSDKVMLEPLSFPCTQCPSQTFLIFPLPRAINVFSLLSHTQPSPSRFRRSQCASAHKGSVAEENWGSHPLNSNPISGAEADIKSLLPMQPSREGSQQRLYQTQCLPLMVGRQATGAGDHDVRARRHAEGAAFSHKRPFNMHYGYTFNIFSHA